MIHRAEPWHRALSEIITGAHIASADDLVNVIDSATARLGLSVRLYLVDLAQRQLNPVRTKACSALNVDTTLAGRAFRLVEIVVAEDEQVVLWMPLLDGTERLGVARIGLPANADPYDTWIREQCWVLTGLMGHLVAGKLPYSDRFHLVRRTRPMSMAAELLWHLLPPQTFACPQAVVTAVMEPYDQVGGDGYDYAVDADQAHLAVFDAVGHDLAAGVTTTLAMAATRNARRAGEDLVAAAAQADQAIADQVGTRFATALLADLDLGTGRLRYLNAGHPPPVLLRHGKMVKTLQSPVRVPLGLGHLTRTAPRSAQSSSNRATESCCTPTASPKPATPTERSSAWTGSSTSPNDTTTTDYPHRKPSAASPTPYSHTSADTSKTTPPSCYSSGPPTPRPACYPRSDTQRALINHRIRHTAPNNRFGAPRRPRSHLQSLKTHW